MYTSIMARFVGNQSTKEVHDTHRPKTQCQLGELVRKKYFAPDTLAQANAEGYDNCARCLGGSQR